jgi:diguanylate cyclase (GGDEF)-like protein/PAS domain S-box-containing protein
VNWTGLIRLPLLVLLVALGVTWAAWSHEQQTARHELRVQFDFALRDAVSRIDQRMVAYEQMLRGVKGVLANSDDDGERQRRRLRDYVEALQLNANFSGVQGIGMVEWVPAPRLARHVDAMRRFGFDAYSVQPQGVRENYAPIVQREPYVGRNRLPPGFDAWSDPVRRRALEQARDSGLPAISGKLELAIDHAVGDAQPGFVMYLPLYRPGAPQGDVGARRASLSGWVFASFRMRDMMASLYGEQASGLALTIYDGVAATPQARLYPAAPATRGPALLTAEEYLVIAGHNWTVSLSALDGFATRLGRNAAPVIAATGAVLSVLLALLAWLLVTGRDRATELAAAMTRELRASEEKFRAIADCTVNLEVWWGLDARPRWINPSVLQYTGYTVEECMAMPDFGATLIHPADLARVRPELRKGLDGLRGDDLEFRCVRKDGSIFWLSLSWVPIHDAQGRFSGFRTSGRDITERKQVETELRIAAVAFDSSEGMLITDAHCVILRVNSAFIDSTGYSAAEVIGLTPRVLRSDRHDDAFFDAMWETIQCTGGWRGEIWDRHKNGEVHAKWLTITAVLGADGGVTHYIASQHDITERKKVEQKIEQLAFYDPLTNLPNRTLLLDRLNHAMTTSKRNRAFGAVLFVDLDHFKTLNDTQGHDKGDLLLQQVAQRLAHCLREGDTVARLGGDEFVVVLESLACGAREAVTETTIVGTKILAALSELYQLGGVVHRASASIGATLFCGHESSIDDVLKQADLAMYKSKETGRNTLRFFDPAMQTSVLARAAMESGLRGAIEEHQFVLHYQAQVDADGGVTGAEALVRWRHPERGLVAPNEFIGLAEETGQIVALGHAVLGAACIQLAAWARQPALADLTIAVNVSVKQFREPDFVATVQELLRRTGANPHRLKLELTESLLVDNMQAIVNKMHALKAQGVGFALDDFGTGYSSLAYLKRLPLDELKIDQSFVRDILLDPNDAAIARTIVALAHSLGLGVIAEGVETLAQRDFLASAGCHAYQGYLFSRPVPLEAFEALATRERLPRALHG